MNKLIGWLVAACATTVVFGVSYWQYVERTKPMFLRGENEEAESGRPPVDGDYWAIRLGYGGDPKHLHFEPKWLQAAARQDKAIASAVPTGAKTYRKSAGSAVTLDADAFTLLGPKPLEGEGFGAGSNAGRTNTIVSDPDNPAVAWLGSDGGGVWKTTNCCTATTTWAVKTDFPEIASMAIGDLTMDPSNHDVLYAGTGDLRYGSFSFGAAGVLKSTDRGETWSLLGEDVFNPFYGPSAGGFPQYQSIGKVVVDPNQSNNVVVGTKTGLFFSNDAGESWTGPCYTNAFATGAGAQRQDMTGLLAVNRAGATMLYAAVGTRGNPTPVQPDLGHNGANAVYRAAMPASGCPAVADWTLLDNGFPAGTGSGTPSNRGRLELAVAASDPLTLYAMFSNSSSSGILGIYKTVDGGDTWTPTGTPSNPGTQMWYDAGLTVSPTDPNVLFLSSVDLFRSSDGGGSFVNLTGAYSGGPVHPDNHSRAIVGGDGNHVLNGCDGGIYYLDNALTATSFNNANWIALNDSLPTIEMYHGDITQNFATSSNAGVTAGFQDNGSASAVFTGAPDAVAWTATNGGDGIVSRIEPVLGQWWYTSIYYASIYVSTSGPFGNQQDISPNLASSDRASFLTPFDLYRYGELDAPDSGCTTAAGCEHIILGTQRVWESTQGGRPASSWAAKTGDLTKNNLIFGSDNRSYINQIHYSVSDPTIAMAATNDGNVQYVFGLGTTAAATAVDVTGGNTLLPNRPMQDVGTDPRNPLVGYAAVGGFSENTPATPGHVFQVTCTAQCASFNWIDKSGNLPDIPANAVIANPNIPNQVFVGMDWGLYYTDDISAAAPVWQRFEGLPHVMVWSLSIDRGFTTLAAFTRSRGAWAWPLPTATGGDNADLAVSIAAPAGAVPGLTFDYSITVTNNGPAAASNVQLDSTLPAGLTFTGNSGDCTTGFPCAFATLAAGASVTVTTHACVARGGAMDPLTVTASVSSDTTDPVVGNNTAAATSPLIAVLFASGFDCP